MKFKCLGKAAYKVTMRCCLSAAQTLYLTLSSMLNSNPFSDDDTSLLGERTAGLDTLLSMLQTTLQTLLEHNTHPNILSQHFRYIFFFINTALVNSLMDTGKIHSTYGPYTSIRVIT